MLGIREQQGQFKFEELLNPERIKTDLFNMLNNPQKVSINLLTDQDVQVLEVDNRKLLSIRIPAASRKQKPVYLNGNPLGNTYRRLHDGDRVCDHETVKRMIAEQVEDARDQHICSHFDLKDLNQESLHAYRNLLKAEKPGHPWLALDDLPFLQMLGGWREDRASGEKGLTVAGLLMFGQWSAITERLPNYFVDYQEKSADPNSEIRWLDRIVPDGSWSGNLFDFYRKVIRKLEADLKIPFNLKEGIRQDDTPIHQALREALINTLAHADYSDRASIRIIKSPTGFSFFNPGLLRVPVEIALQGGASDCRNRAIQQMFLMIGLGERAGSGLPKILHGWQDAGNRLVLQDSIEPYDHTILEMLWDRADGLSNIDTTPITTPIQSAILETS